MITGEFIEIIKLTDFKEKEIESFYIDPLLSDEERITYIMKKGFLCQKRSLVSNLKDYFLSKSCINTFFNILEDKFLDMEQELQLHIIETLTIFYICNNNLYKRKTKNKQNSFSNSISFNESASSFRSNKGNSNNNNYSVFSSNLINKKEYKYIIDNFSNSDVNTLLVIIIKSVVNDEKNEKNTIYLDLFDAIVTYYENSKITLDSDFITYVVNLASFGKSSLSRKYSVIFSSGFLNIIDEYNTELIDRMFRSATDMEQCVRLAIAQGYFYLGKYVIKYNNSLLPKLFKNMEKYLTYSEDIQTRKETLKSVVLLLPYLSVNNDVNNNSNKNVINHSFNQNNENSTKSSFKSIIKNTNNTTTNTSNKYKTNNIPSSLNSIKNNSMTILPNSQKTKTSNLLNSTKSILDASYFDSNTTNNNNNNNNNNSNNNNNNSSINTNITDYDIEDFYQNNLEDTTLQILTDPNYTTKNFINYSELLTLKLDLVNTLLINYKSIETFNIGVQIKKFFYMSLFFANKLTLNEDIVEFSIKKFHLLSLLESSPYSPNKQKKLYQVAFQYQSKNNNGSFPDMDIPITNKNRAGLGLNSSMIDIENNNSIISNLNDYSDTYSNNNNSMTNSIIRSNYRKYSQLNSINTNTNLNINNTTTNNSNNNYISLNTINSSRSIATPKAGFTFSVNWTSELFKVLLEAVFAKKIDEVDNQNYNIKLITTFFNNLSNILPSLDKKLILMLIEKIEKKLEDSQIFALIVEKLEGLCDALISNKKNIESMFKMLSNKKRFIMSSLFKPNDDEELLLKNIIGTGNTSVCSKFIDVNGEIVNNNIVGSNINIIANSNIRSISNNAIGGTGITGTTHQKRSSISSINKYNNSSSINVIKNNDLTSIIEINQKLNHQYNWRAIHSFYYSIAKTCAYYSSSINSNNNNNNNTSNTNNTNNTTSPYSPNYQQSFSTSIAVAKNEESNELILFLLNDCLDKIVNNYNYQLQKSFIEVLIVIFGFSTTKIREELISKVIKSIFKNRNYFIRRLCIDFSEMFVLKYSFSMFKEIKLYFEMLKLLRDFYLADSMLDFFWRVYPFIEDNEEMKSEFNKNLNNLLSCASFKVPESFLNSSMNGNEVDSSISTTTNCNNGNKSNGNSQTTSKNNSSKKNIKILLTLSENNNSGNKINSINNNNINNNINSTTVNLNNISKKLSPEYNGYCSKQKSSQIIKAIDEFRTKTKKIHSYLNVTTFVENDNEKFFLMKEKLNNLEYSENKPLSEIKGYRAKHTQVSSKNSNKMIDSNTNNNTNNTNSSVIKEVNPKIIHSSEVKRHSIKPLVSKFSITDNYNYGNNLNIPNKHATKKPISSQDLGKLAKHMSLNKASFKNNVHNSLNNMNINKNTNSSISGVDLPMLNLNNNMSSNNMSSNNGKVYSSSYGTYNKYNSGRLMTNFHNKFRKGSDDA